MPDHPTRRAFLAAGPLAALAAPDTPAAAPPRPPIPHDPPRELPATGSELGSLFPEVEAIARANRHAFAFPGGRFRTYAEYRAASHAKVLELLRYRPAPV